MHKEKPIWVNITGDWDCPICQASNDYKAEDPNSDGELKCKKCGLLIEVMDDGSCY